MSATTRRRPAAARFDDLLRAEAIVFRALDRLYDACLTGRAEVYRAAFDNYSAVSQASDALCKEGQE